MVEVFVPSSLTCLFAPVLREPKTSGSLGIGITIDKGVVVSVKSGEDFKILFNGEEIDIPTVEYVAKSLGFEGVVKIDSEVPLGCGFGISSASSLGCAIAIDRVMDLNKSFFELADLCHVSEVINRTGLGDVTTQSFAGVVVRKTPGLPSTAEIDRFLWNLEFDFLIMGKLKTDEILSDFELKRIYEIGLSCLKRFLRKPSVENLFRQSRVFAEECGFMDSDVLDAIESVENSNGMAGMVMLGKTVFALNGEVLKDLDGMYFKSVIDLCGVRFLKQKL
jgi:pantoate kinase